MKKLLILLIDAYRLLLSPFFGTQCRFYPTCSAYAREAIDTHGAIKGSWLTVRRLGKCHPWHEGGIDNVPPRRSDYQEGQSSEMEPQSIQPVIPPLVIYRNYMADAKLRILSAEKILTSPEPVTGYTSLDMEFCFLQIRRVIESITFGAMIREKRRYVALRDVEKNANNKDHGDATKDWQAPEILKRLVSLSPHALPIPHKDGKESSPDLFHFDRQEIEVNHGRLIDLYKRSGAFLHAKNPIGHDFNSLVETQRKNYVEAPTEVRRALKFLRQLLWQHAAVTLEPAGQDDPRTAASPKYVWLVSFGNSPGEEINIVVGESMTSNDSSQQGPEPAGFRN